MEDLKENNKIFFRCNKCNCRAMIYSNLIYSFILNILITERNDMYARTEYRYS